MPEQVHSVISSILILRVIPVHDFIGSRGLELLSSSGPWERCLF